MPVAPDPVAAWAASGAMSLTGWPDRAPLGPPLALVATVESAAARLDGAVDEPLALLGERAAHLGLVRAGRTSCGGSARLLPTGDGWIALNLARPEDLDLLPAWLGREVEGDPWEAVSQAARERAATDLLAAAVGLGLPLAQLPDRIAVPSGSDELPVRWWPGRSDPAPSPSVEGLRVVDLTSLWAGPLCGSLLAELGADVVKVESIHRPDGARRGPRGFFDVLNGAKRSVALDLADHRGRTQLRRLVEQADVVLEASRPRALRSLGIDADHLVASAQPRAWVSITGYGRTGDAQHRVAFGDDAAVGGGLVGVEEDGTPVFCADAVADPIAGLVAAAAVVEAVARGGAWLVEAAMAEAAGAGAGPPRPVPDGTVAAAPRSRPVTRSAPDLGAHTVEVLRSLR